MPTCHTYSPWLRLSWQKGPDSQNASVNSKNSFNARAKFNKHQTNKTGHCSSIVGYEFVDLIIGKCFCYQRLTVAQVIMNFNWISINQAVLLEIAMCTGTTGDYSNILGVTKHNFSANIPHPMEDDKTGKLVQINRKWQMFLLLIWRE